jgi:tape measure domain-containing protein
MAANRIYIQVDFQNAAINELNKNIGNIGTTSQRASQQTQGAFSGMRIAIEQTSTALLGMGNAIAGLAAVRFLTSMIQTADAIRRVEIAMTSLTGSATVGMRVLGEIAVMSRTQPFSFQSLAEAARSMAVFGFNAKTIPGDVAAIANAVARLGGTSHDIDSITYALGIMREKGVAQAQQLFRQLAAQGIPVFEFIRKGIEQQTGQILSDDEIRKLMEKGRLAGEGVADAILVGLGKLPNVAGKMMELPTSQWEKVKDQAAFLAETLEKQLAPAILSVIGGIQSLIHWFGQLAPETQTTTTYFIGLVGAVGALGLAFKVLGGPLLFLFNKIADFGGLLLSTMGTLARFTAFSAVAIRSLGLKEFLSGMGGLELGATGVTVATGLTVLATAIAALTAAIASYFGGKQLADIFPEETVAFLKWLADHPVLMTFLSAGAGPLAGAAVMGAASQTQTRLSDLEQMSQQARNKGITGDTIRQQVMAETARNIGPIIKPDTEAIKHQIEEAQAILARAQEREAGGLAEIERKYEEQIANATKALDEAYASRADKEKVFGLLRLANEANVQHQIQEYEKKTADESAKIHQRALEEQAAAAEKFAARQAELAGAVAQDTLSKQAQVVTEQYRIEVAGAVQAAQLRQKAAEGTRDQAITDLKQQFVRGTINYKEYLGSLINVWEEYLAQFNKAWDGAYEKIDKRQDDILKKLTEGTTQTAVFKREAEIEIAVAKQTSAAKQAVLEEDYNQRIAADEWYATHVAELADAARTDEVAATAELVQKETMLRNDAVQTQILAEASARKKANEAFIEEQKQVYDKLKSAIGTVWDAFFQKGKSVWQALADAAKKAFMDMAKELITSNIAASMMRLFTGQTVTMESRGSFGGPLGKLAGIFTQRPVFGTKPLGDLQDLKLVTTQPPPGTQGIPVYLVNPVGGDGQKEMRVTQNTRTQVEFSGSVGGSAAGVAAATAALMGVGPAPSVSSGGTSTSAVINYSGGGSESFGFGGGSITTPPFMPGSIPGVGDAPGLGPGMGLPGGFGVPGGGIPGLGGIIPSAIGIASKAAAGGLTWASMGGPLLLGSMIGLKGAYSLGQSVNPIAKAAAIPVGAVAGMAGVVGLGALFPDLLGTALLGGPLGLAVGAAIGAGIGLYGLLHKTDAQKAHDAVQKAYGIDISNQGVLNAIAQAAKKYGDFNVGIMSPEVQQIIHMYTLSQGINATGILPRPMYSATLAQSSAAGGLQLQPVYSNGQLVASPYSGATTQQWSQGLYIQLNPQQANDLLTGKIVDALNNNPGTVATANATGLASGNGITAQRNALIEPLTVMS